jgi:hypothetical protein
MLRGMWTLAMSNPYGYDGRACGPRGAPSDGRQPRTRHRRRNHNNRVDPDSQGGALVRAVSLAAVLLAALALAACSSDTDDGDAASAPDQPAAAAPTVAVQATATLAPVATLEASSAPAPTTAPDTATAADPTATTAPASEPEATAVAVLPAVDVPVTVSTSRCAAGLSLAEQKAQLVVIAKELFAGETTEGENRLKFDPDARDQRSGGIWVTLEFSGNERGTVTQKKAALDSQMRDAFDALFNSGCDQLAWVDLTGIHRAIVKVGQMGETIPVPAPVFKTRLKRDGADAVDWANKEALDFNEIWDELLLNIRWRDELREEAGQ